MIRLCSFPFSGIHAVSLAIAEHPANVQVHVRTDNAPKDYKMSCRLAGSNIPMGNPWRRGKIALSDKGKYRCIRSPPNGTEGVVTWTLQFLSVSKDSKVLGNYSCELNNVKSNNATLTLAGE